MNKKDIYMAGPWVTKKEEKIVLDAVRNGWYGAKAYYYVEKFEYEFAKYHNKKYTLITPNYTTTLHLILNTLDVREKDKVIAPECTWIGSVACIKYQNAKTVLADIDSTNWCLSAENIEKNITSKTKAVIVVDLYGNMPDWDDILYLCNKKNIHVIEDSAEALGSKYNSIKAGKFGIASTFSFHRTKTLTTGEGGMLLIDDNKLYKRCKFLRDHGRRPGSYYNTEVAFKYMPFNLQAALGYAQFLRIDELIKKKKWILNEFKRNLSHIDDLYFNYEPSNVENGAWSPVLVFGKSLDISRDNIIKEITKHNYPARPFFYPLSSLPAYNQKKNKINNPVSYDISNRGIHLPCALNLTIDQISRYSKVISKYIQRKSK